MVRIKLLVEGGGDGKQGSVKKACRRGFRLFLEKAGLAGQMPEIIACGSRQEAYNRFVHEHGNGNHVVVLLVDAEGPVTSKYAWEHLNWNRPAGARDDQCHLMTQVMESWFLADLPALRKYYDRDFHENALPKNPNVEEVPKQDVLKGLANATRHTQKGAYDKNKGEHSFGILAKLDSDWVAQAAPNAKRFIEDMKRYCSS